jgi:aldose 1-epimerase
MTIIVYNMERYQIMKTFGKLDTGATVYEYILKNEDAEVAIITFGAIVRKFTVFGRDIVGGYDDIEGYLADDSHQGGIIGRVANRVANAKFVMDGKEYKLPKNDGENCLHGGVGFDRRIWSVKEASDESILLSLRSENMEEGFPSALEVEVRYTLIGSALKIEYSAIPDGKTPIALTNHSYFNLNGLGGTILEHTVEIFADRYTEVGDDLIPNGSRPELKGTAFDLTKPIKIGTHVGGDFIGYDHNFILCPTEFDGGLGLAARVVGDEFKMSVYTDQPGVQFYIGNFLGGEPDFKGGIKRVLHGAFCLETQTEPNCINHGIGFYDKGEKYTHTTIYKIEKK